MHAELIAAGRDEIAGVRTDYEPSDRDEKLGIDPPYDSALLAAWEEAHGHDVRLKCYPEFGCRVLEATLAVHVAKLADALEEAEARIAAVTDRMVGNCPHPPRIGGWCHPCGELLNLLHPDGIPEDD